MLRRFLALLGCLALYLSPASAQLGMIGIGGGDFGGAAANIATTLGTASVFGATGQGAITSTVAAPIGRLVVCAVHDNYEAATAGTFTSSPSNTWTLGARAVSVANADAQIFYSFLTSALPIGSTMTYTTAIGFTGSNTINSGCASYTGFTSVDSGISNNATNFSGSYSVTGAASGAVSGELNVGLISGGNAPVFPTGWTTAPPDMPGIFDLTGYQINAGTSPLTFAGTLTAQWWAAAIVAFKP